MQFYFLKIYFYAPKLSFTCEGTMKFIMHVENASQSYMSVQWTAYVIRLNYNLELIN